MTTPLGDLSLDSLLELAYWLALNFLHRLAQLDARAWILLLALLMVLLGWTSRGKSPRPGGTRRKSAEVIVWQGRGGD